MSEELADIYQNGKQNELLKKAKEYERRTNLLLRKVQRYVFPSESVSPKQKSARSRS